MITNLRVDLRFKLYQGVQVSGEAECLAPAP